MDSRSPTSAEDKIRGDDWRSGSNRRFRGPFQVYEIPPRADLKVRATARNARLVHRAQFLAGKAVTSPGDSFEAMRGNFRVASFTVAVSAADTTA